MKEKRCCSCKGPLRPCEAAAYVSRCENCWVNANTRHDGGHTKGRDFGGALPAACLPLNREGHLESVALVI